MTSKEKARRLRDKALETWTPFLNHELNGEGTKAQTAVLLTLAWTFGKEFLGELPEVQDKVIKEGLAVFEKELL